MNSFVFENSLSFFYFYFTMVGFRILNHINSIEDRKEIKYHSINFTESNTKSSNSYHYLLT